MRAHLSPRRAADCAIAALLLAGAADALFFDTLGRSAGLSALVFAALLAFAIALCHRPVGVRRLAPHMLLLCAAFAALIENVDWMSLALATTGLAIFALAAARRLPASAHIPEALGRFLLAAPLALLRAARVRDKARCRSKLRGPSSRPFVQAWLVWIMPVGLAFGFVVLLAAGNPILEHWLGFIDPYWIASLLAPGRIAFWGAVLVLTWPFLRPRFRRTFRSRSAPAESASQEGAWPTSGSPTLGLHLYGRAAILRALLLFNAVFAVQTLLDGVYLWGGLELPSGISYAAYAHRGAYMLVVTALLAAGFVLVALRPGSAAAGDGRIRTLVYLWIGQNVVLVLSAILRLDLYVDVYALTHWRLAAFVWMGIVAAGLLLICVRVAGRRSNQWLVGANLAVLAIVSVGFCFVDDRALIAGFNVSHSRDVSGRGVRLDIDHLVALGPAAIPAIDRYLAHAATAPQAMQDDRTATFALLRGQRQELAEDHRSATQDWRMWTFRKWRLSRYLEAHVSPPVPPVPMGPPFPPLTGPS